LGLAAHLSAWILVGLVVFVRGGDAWFPAVPTTRIVVLILGGGLIVLAWLRATQGVWLLAVHSLSIAALGLVVLEMALGAHTLREQEPSRYPFPYRMHGFAPNRSADDNVHRATSNDVGMREPQPISVQKAPATVRILVLGGSAMFGIGAADGESAPAHLERILNGERSGDLPPGIERVEVINAGQGWYNSTQVLIYFLTELWRYEPDIVLIVDGYNDVLHSVVWSIPPPLNQVSFDAINWMRGLPGIWDQPGWEHAIFVGARASALRRFLGLPAERFFAPAAIRRGSREQPLPESSAAEPLVFRQLLANWVAFDAIARRMGFRVHFALQPLLSNKETITRKESLLFERLKDYGPVVQATWRRLEDYVAEQGERRGLDLFSSETYVRRSDRALFLDYCHLVSDGYALVALAMADVVTRDFESWPWKTAWPPLGDPVAQGGLALHATAP
jgi:hypothetical protein